MKLALVLLALAVASPLPQARRPRRPDPQAQMQEYYRQYPDRYIRVSKESWKYEEKTRTAAHSFTLTNTANATYHDLRVRFTYQTSKGKTLHTVSAAIEGFLLPFQSMQVKGTKVKNVPGNAEAVLVVVEKASVRR